eukprot:UN20929
MYNSLCNLLRTQCNNFAYKCMYLIGVLSHVLSLSSNKGFHSISKAFYMFLWNRMISFFLSRHSRIDILIQIRNSVKRY